MIDLFLWAGALLGVVLGSLFLVIAVDDKRLRFGSICWCVVFWAHTLVFLTLLSKQ